eukprot:TRINITY_DN60905_c0_g1_i1.p1 TRINITY_DN60905_c0_g1~~TRINITY_DN60905_c0_g1_i1.p1  ORF type:complete len:214 (-),score=43.74 TRINITY_DN60905_c0_g1_i1:368-1009(-)
MYTALTHRFAKAVRFQVLCNSPDPEPLPFEDAMRLLHDGDPDLVRLLVDSLRTAFPSTTPIFWEHPPVSSSTVNRPYEFSAIPAAGLRGVRANSSPFSEHLRQEAPGGSCVFPNLGGDALLVVPVPGGSEEESTYAHLASFLARATSVEVQKFLSQAGGAVLRRLEETEAPIYVSTSGLGVAWLHLRLDAKPKYYTFQPYRNADPTLAELTQL